LGNRGRPAQPVARKGGRREQIQREGSLPWVPQKTKGASLDQPARLARVKGQNPEKKRLKKENGRGRGERGWGEKQESGVEDQDTPGEKKRRRPIRKKGKTGGGGNASQGRSRGEKAFPPSGQGPIKRRWQKLQRGDQSALSRKKEGEGTKTPGTAPQRVPIWDGQRNIPPKNPT